MGYILGERPEGCIFCTKPREERDADNFILRRGERCYAILNTFPYNNGHLMVVPYEHVADIDALDGADLTEIMVMARSAVKIMQQLMHPDGFNLGLNIGRTAGAGIDEHLHLHVVPRWNGDTNFMPVLDDAKIIPQSLEACYELLAPALQAAGADILRADASK
jgi:ATP adenylyltransferase